MKLKTLNEDPHRLIAGLIPDELAFMQGGDSIDLGFENLGIAKDVYLALSNDLDEVGLDTGTGYCFHIRNAYISIERPTGNEAALPQHWPTAVMVLDDNRRMWVGTLYQKAKGLTDQQLKAEGLSPVDGGWLRQ